MGKKGQLAGTEEDTSGLGRKRSGGAGGPDTDFLSGVLCTVVTKNYITQAAGRGKEIVSQFLSSVHHNIFVVSAIRLNVAGKFLVDPPKLITGDVRRLRSW